MTLTNHVQRFSGVVRGWGKRKKEIDQSRYNGRRKKMFHPKHREFVREAGIRD